VLLPNVAEDHVGRYESNGKPSVSKDDLVAGKGIVVLFPSGVKGRKDGVVLEELGELLA